MGYHLISVEPLVNLTGLDGAVIRLLTGIFIAYPLAFVYGLILYKKNPTLQHFFLTVYGVFLAVFLYGLEGLHTVVAIIVQYLLIHLIGPNSMMIIASFAFQMCYLIIGYWVYSTDLYDIAWTTAQCILVLRLLGVAWDTYDGAQDLEKASADTKEMALRTPPGFLEMTGHAYFFGSFIVGPQFPMSRYLSFIKGTLIPPEHDQQNIKIKRGLLRLAAGIVYLTFHALIEPSFNNAYLVSKEFETLSLIKKFAYITVWGRAALCKYLAVWLIAEGSCIMSGLTYNGRTELGEARWDALKNCKITIYETTITLQGVIDSFNVNTNMWMSRYLFKRLRFLGNKTLSHVITLMFLAIWHGVYIGYFVCFSSEYFYINAEKEILTVLGRGEEKISPTSLIFKIRWVIMYLLKAFIMSYCLLPFVLLTWTRIFQVYKTTYALPHLFVLAWVIFYNFIYPSLRTKESSKKKE
ncbi:lysophospholipid acyltransferase 5-like [Dendronephthya gigantea]|uniref:lysophospholipid acyltransferase 5-like n=1 Tax=Dendronephthya gigantea TaxID=151771 RepID=UPI00106B7E12|nr:lysophospholipid acyltransferase 5-like [Dendronephthya gigantea]